MADGQLELRLHLTHPRIPDDLSPFWTRSAAVCLNRHDHPSPVSFVVSTRDDTARTYDAEWDSPTDDQVRALDNEENTTEYGAYCVALAAAFAHLGRMALRRTGAGTGADWWLVPATADTSGSREYDLDRPDLAKLEVSGVDAGSDSVMAKRLDEKVAQVRRGRVPVQERYAGVVGFRVPEVRFAKA